MPKSFLSSLFTWHHPLQLLFREHLRAFHTGFKNIAIIPMATFTTILAIGFCLSLPMGLYLFIKNISTLTHSWEQGTSITIYLDPQTSATQAKAILSQIKQTPSVNKATYITPDEALREFQTYSNVSDTLALLQENPLPGVISVQLDSVALSQSHLLALKQDFSNIPKVQLVTWDDEWTEKLKGFLAVGKRFSQFLYLIMGFGIVFMVGNTIRLAMERHRDEIEVFSLIGATGAYIRRPFLYRGILYGGLGGLTALIILSIGLFFLASPVNHLISLYEGVSRIQSLSFSDTLYFFSLSALLGWLGAIFAFAQQKRAIYQQS